VVAHDEPDLLLEVRGEEVRAGERRAVAAGLERRAVRQPRVDVEFGKPDVDADIRIVRVDGTDGLAAPAARERVADGRDTVSIEVSDARDGLAGGLANNDVARRMGRNGTPPRLSRVTPSMTQRRVRLREAAEPGTPQARTTTLAPTAARP
jgi:hypothetical protein